MERVSHCRNFEKQVAQLSVGILTYRLVCNNYSGLATRRSRIRLTVFIEYLLFLKYYLRPIFNSF